MKKRMISAIVAIITAISLTITPVGAIGNLNLRKNAKDGFAMPNLASICYQLKGINSMINSLFGFEIMPKDSVNITVDNMVQSIIGYVLEISGVDFSEVYLNIPDTKQYSNFIRQAIGVNVDKIRDALNTACGEFSKKGMNIPAALCCWTSVWLGCIDSCEICAIPVKGSKDVYRIGAKITFADGSSQTLVSEIYYDDVKKEFFGIDGKDALLGYNMNLNDCVVTTGVHTWQRLMGYTVAYDVFCYLTPFFFNYLTQRIYFIYDNLEFRVQLWKGRYAISNGAEVGFYTRPIGSKGTFFNCANDDYLVKMSLELYHGDNCLFRVEPTEHWWITGFQVDNTTYFPHTMTLVSTITMKDNEMLKAFTQALEKKKGMIDYKVSGLDVTLTW